MSSLLIAAAIAVLVIILLVGVILIREHLTRTGVPQKVDELRRHINAILDLAGCREAKEHFNEVVYIVENYGIQLLEAGYNGTLADLKTEASRSVGRYEGRIRVTDQVIKRAL